MDQSNTRSDFEAWMKRNYPTHSLRKVNGLYVLAGTHHKWLGWQGAMKTLQVSKGQP